MKKTLLFAFAIALSSTLVSGQGVDKVWAFGTDTEKFPVGNRFTATLANEQAFVDELGIHKGTIDNNNMGAITAGAKTFGDYSFVNRFQFNGGGYTGSVNTDATPTVMMPTQRYITFSVGGNSEIKVIGITGSSSQARTLFFTNGTTLVGSAAFAAGSDAAEFTINYTGPATTIYAFCNAACNLYRLSATNVVTNALKSTSTNNTFKNNEVYFNGTEIVNSKNIALEVFNVLGKRVLTSSSNISTRELSQGIYIIRAEGSKEVLKIKI